MKQVFLSGKGEIEVFDVPIPGRMSGSVLVRNAFSLISTGTEGAAISRRGGWLGVAEKALNSRDRLQQVWQLAQRQGIARTFTTVQRKLDDYTTPGYSCAGQVIEVDNVPGINPGDRVACIGTGFATHSEYIVVPTNLIVPLPSTVQYNEAAFGALACIAMQGIRRLELTPGEVVGVIGLGLIGQIAVQLLKAMGYVGIGIDLRSERAKKAHELANIEAWGMSDCDSLARVQQLTHGRGLDGIIICAATSSDQPVNQAFELCRKRGRVSIIGDVGLNLVRAKMYQKELELRLSCSYGPGRYDDAYEVQGQDYPLGYVRWTEGRNLAYFVQLLQQGALNLSPLINLRTPIEQASEGYAFIKQGNADTYAVLLDYGVPPQLPTLIHTDLFSKRRANVDMAKGAIRLGIIGCGSFVKGMHLPNLQRLPQLFQIYGLASRTGATAELIARKLGTPISTSDYHVLLEDEKIEAVLIATRHSNHAKIVLDALAAGKHVFVEKPLCITEDEGEQIVRAAHATGLVVRVGFNRRFSSALGQLRNSIGKQGLRIFTCRVNIGALTNDWSSEVDEGGRLLGEGVHFFDLCNWFMNSSPTRISACIVGESKATNPNALVQLHYPDGSAAHVIYTTLGHPSGGKEYFEAFGNNCVASCDDYVKLNIFSTSSLPSKFVKGDKGHLSELREFAAAIKGQLYPIVGADANAGLLATRMALLAYESMKTSCQINLTTYLDQSYAGITSEI
ncbi:MAG: bi-domain-containing oxidoreductase [Caldilineaceae bacterium]